MLRNNNAVQWQVVNDMYDSTMESLLDEHAPRRKIILRKVPGCPWFDGTCASSKKQTRRLERQFRNSPSEERECRWRTQVKAQRKLFQQKRSNYLRDSIEGAQGNGRTLWKSLNTLLTPPQDTSPRISPDTLLNYFENKIDMIRESTKDAPMPDLSTVPPPAHSLCKFDEITTAEVEKLISDSSTKQCELDSAPVWLIKSLYTVFAPILALLINISITQASLPAKHKRAIIRPCVKKSGLDPTDPASYRPISNLSFISKLVERVTHKQLSDYVESNHLLPPTQSGFRRHHSTETAVIKVYNDIILALDSGFITVLLLLDFSAAFDYVDHTLLLKTMQVQFGITASAIQWIASFLSSRSYSIKLGGCSSKIFTVLFGVPQGSILGPLLFIL